MTQPDKPVGRKQELTPPAVKVLAEKDGIEILQPEKLTSPNHLLGKEGGIDIFIVVAYGTSIGADLSQAQSLVHTAHHLNDDLLQLAQYSNIANPFVRFVVAALLVLEVDPIHWTVTGRL